MPHKGKIVILIFKNSKIFPFWKIGAVLHDWVAVSAYSCYDNIGLLLTFKWVVLLAHVIDNILFQFLFFMNIKCSAVYKYCAAYFAVQRYTVGRRFFEWGNLIILEMSWMKSKYAVKVIILLSVDVRI